MCHGARWVLIIWLQNTVHTKNTTTTPLVRASHDSFHGRFELGDSACQSLLGRIDLGITSSYVLPKSMFQKYRRCGSNFANWRKLASWGTGWPAGRVDLDHFMIKLRLRDETQQTTCPTIDNTGSYAKSSSFYISFSCNTKIFHLFMCQKRRQPWGLIRPPRVAQ